MAPLQRPTCPIKLLSFFSSDLREMLCKIWIGTAIDTSQLSELPSVPGPFCLFSVLWVDNINHMEQAHGYTHSCTYSTSSAAPEQLRPLRTVTSWGPVRQP